MEAYTGAERLAAGLLGPFRALFSSNSGEPIRGDS